MPEQGLYLAEWYRSGLNPPLVDDVVDELIRAAGPTDRAQVRPSVRVVVIVAVPTDDVLYGLFCADSGAAVNAVCRGAGLPAQRLTAGIDARIIQPATLRSGCAVTYQQPPAGAEFPEGRNSAPAHPGPAQIE